MNLSDIELSKKDFVSSEWKDIVNQCEKKEANRYKMPFWEKAKEAKSVSNSKKYAVFAILSAISSLHLKPELTNDTFANIEGIDGITDEHLNALEDWASIISDAELRARIADLLWTKKRRYQMAQLAIDAYVDSASVLEDPEHWTSCVDRIERAIRLARQINHHVDVVVAHIESVLDKYDGEDPLFLSARLMELLQGCKQGDSQKYSALAEKAAIHKESQEQPSWHIVRNYWRIKAGWHHLEKDKEQERLAWLNLCETYVKQSREAVSRNNYLEASSHLDRAIQAFRRTSNTQQRVEEVRQILREYQQKAAEQIQMTSSSVRIDITEMVKLAKEDVKDKSFLEAIFSLAKLGKSVSVEYLRQQVLEDNQKYILKDLFPTVIVNEKGQVQARQASINSSNAEIREAAIRADMQQYAKQHKSTHVQAYVESARYQINLEHSVRLDDWTPIVFNSPFVPPNREVIFAKGLHAGLTDDFLTSSHFLIPQIEHSIRSLLIQRGVITSHIGDDGIENEYALTKTLYMPEVKEIFGDDITFDLQGLLVDKFGSNLRNLNCHGLIDYPEFLSAHHIYLWWLTLRLCCLPIISSNQNETT